MKKVISMLLFVATALVSTSCDEIDDFAEDLLGNTNGEIEYTGALTVVKGDTKTYFDDDVEFELEAKDSKVSIMMNDVCFDSGMPFSIDVKISDMTAIKGIFSTSSIIPTNSNGEPQPSRTLTDVSGIYTDTTLTLKFSYGDYDVAYVGVADKE